MNNPLIPILIALAALAVGAAIGYLYSKKQVEDERKLQGVEADQIIRDAHKKAEAIALDAKNDAIKTLQEAENDAKRRRSELNREENRLQKRRDDLDRRIERIERREANLNKRQSAIDRRGNEIDKLYEEQAAKLESISQMTLNEARELLLSEAEKEARNDMARIIRQVEEEAREQGEQRARDIVALSIQRIASEHVTEITTSSVPLPSDDMKGRIIGRNGRNIRAFEQTAGVDVIVDDTPEAITISCFDPVRREIARRSMEKLVVDGRIHPAHIEKVVAKERAEVERVLAEAGEQAAYDAGVPGLPNNITKTLGRLKFRTSYGQNQLSHAVETSRLAAIIAVEIGANVELARAGGLLHDLGKAIDHNVEGTHASIGADLARRAKLHPVVINAIEAHHHEVEQESVEAVIVEAADAISGARPGARRENLEDYVKRIKSLEDMAKSYKGVVESYALQAGREVRIIVKPTDVDDLGATRMSRDIARQIEETMQYPGQIKVTVIRESRSVEYAK